MKHLLLATLSFTLFTGCHKKEDPAPDPFLGHWQAESYSYVLVDTKGQAGSPFGLVSRTITLEVTATTTQFTYGAGSTPDAPVSYTRSGEVLTPTTPIHNASDSFFVRSLTASSFIFEQAETRSDRSVLITRIPFHR
jgi:hypothetical protein